jgi:hypothetical protein
MKAKTQEELIAYYEKELEKVLSTYGEDGYYADSVRKDIEEVKNGRNW